MRIRGRRTTGISIIAMACFRYNTTVNGATGMTPFKAMFGIDGFELDNEIGL